MRHYADKSLKYNNGIPPKHYPKPEITAQANDKDPEEIDTISISALSSFPELLTQSWGHKKTKKHQADCECEACEHDNEVSELDF